MKSKILASGLLTLLVLLPLVVLAAATSSPATPSPEPTTMDIAGLLEVIKTISRWLLSFLLVLVVIFVLWAAFLFVTAGGNPAKVEEARARLIFAAIGVAVALLAWSVPTIIKGILGV